MGREVRDVCGAGFVGVGSWQSQLAVIPSIQERTSITPPRLSSRRRRDPIQWAIESSQWLVVVKWTLFLRCSTAQGLRDLALSDFEQSQRCLPLFSQDKFYYFLRIESRGETSDVCGAGRSSLNIIHSSTSVDSSLYLFPPL